MKKIVLFLLTLLFLLGCEEKKESDFENLSMAYVDILIAKEKFSNDFNKFNSVRDSILNKYELSDSSYNRKLKELISYSEDWESFYDSSQSYLRRLRDKK